MPAIAYGSAVVRPPQPIHLDGSAVYGDDFAEAEIAEWFADEANAYIDMTGEGVEEFGYTQWAIRYGYRRLPQRQWGHVLGFGAAQGGELLPLARAADRITILESSTKYEPERTLQRPADVLLAKPSGDIDLPDASVDLLTCFGVLHHIPNVSHVLHEFARVVEPDGYLLLREPITSMGNWSGARPGLTPHERGFRLDVLRRLVGEAGFTIHDEALLGFSPISWLWRVWKAPYNSRGLTVLDHAICEALRWHVRYDARTRWQKVRPTSVALVCHR